MIKVEPKRVKQGSHRLSQPTTHPKISREELRGVYAQGEAAVIALVEGLLARSEQLEERVATLENQLSKNSRNSSKPPSGDGFGKHTRSLRSKSMRQSGGQAEHPGQTLAWCDDVDWLVEHRVDQCQGCGVRLDEVPVERVVARQVHALPALRLEVSEHQAEVKGCPLCGLEHQGRFPVAVSHEVQYGPVRQRGDGVSDGGATVAIGAHRGSIA